MGSMKQFEKVSIQSIDPSYFYFDCGMVHTCKPTFDRCDTNYDVEAVLRKAGVIRKNNRTDTESCSLVVLFSTRKAGEAFLARLNKFLEAHQHVSLDANGNGTDNTVKQII